MIRWPSYVNSMEYWPNAYYLIQYTNAREYREYQFEMKKCPLYFEKNSSKPFIYVHNLISEIKQFIALAKFYASFLISVQNNGP